MSLEATMEFFRRRRRRRRGDRRDRAAAASSAVARAVAASAPSEAAPGALPDDDFEACWRGALRGRVLVVLGALALWTAGLEARLVQLQVVQHKDMVALAARQQKREIELVPPRGDIVDRNGELLAYSVDGQALVADPNAVDDAGGTAARVCHALGDCDAEKLAGLRRSLARRSAFAYLDRQVSPDQATRLDALKLPGVRLIPEPRRYYPKLELAAHVLGFVGVDNEGLGGVERTYDDVVRGTAGRMLLQVDARRKGMDARVQQSPAPGATLELTLDLYLQHIVERELRAGVEASRARGGSAVVMDPRNGEILALASYPTFNPNAFQEFSDDQKRNRAIQDIYEPGSTFKIVTASAALEDGVFRIDDLIDTNPGVIAFPGRKADYGGQAPQLRRADRRGRHRPSRAISARSRSASRSARSGWARYIRQFGFGQALLPDLSGQSRGIVWNPANLNDSALASISMGYQVGVTPLQMATAASVVANGGMLYRAARRACGRARRCARAGADQTAAARDQPARRRQCSPRSWKASSSAAPASRRDWTTIRLPARRARRRSSWTDATLQPTTTSPSSDSCPRARPP